ncbi:manganese efflux pump MntP family protein [Pseudooceanicola sp. CBS1P-1]|nr:manganese efflux pump MntP family protein [Pseudooceanicola endophyticus]
MRHLHRRRPNGGPPRTCDDFAHRGNLRRDRGHHPSCGLAGVAASQYVAEVDHWIAFALLAEVSIHMALRTRTRTDDEPRSTFFGATIITAIGTSIDAMAVSVFFAFLQVISLS